MTARRPLESFMALVGYHEELDLVFQRHMEALLRLDLKQAWTLLDRFQRELIAHMEAEEEVMLPVYGERAGDVPGGSVEIFSAEHKKMRELVAGFVRAMKELRPEPRQVLALLDKEFTFKHLMEHHDLREINLLYRWMDRITSADERRAMLRRLEELDGMVPRSARNGLCKAERE